ncbi:MAG: hypothetical protein ABR545_01110 [Cyclonatronaceae bacterium]
MFKINTPQGSEKGSPVGFLKKPPCASTTPFYSIRRFAPGGEKGLRSA